jgi:hypothetical protein
MPRRSLRKSIRRPKLKVVSITRKSVSRKSKKSVSRKSKKKSKSKKSRKSKRTNSMRIYRMGVIDIGINNMPPPMRPIRRQYAHSQQARMVLGYIMGYEEMPTNSQIRAGFPDVFRLDLDNGNNLHDLTREQIRRYHTVKNRYEMM